jgi:hypothetical protein
MRRTGGRAVSIVVFVPPAFWSSVDLKGGGTARMVQYRTCSHNKQDGYVHDRSMCMRRLGESAEGERTELSLA